MRTMYAAYWAVIAAGIVLFLLVGLTVEFEAREGQKGPEAFNVVAV